MSEKRSLTTQNDPIYKLLANYKPAIESVLPKHLTPEKMLRIAFNVIHRTPKLKECTPVSLINAVMEISILGLEIGRTAHIIPFKKEAVVIVDYKGMIELAHRSEKVVNVVLKPVYENDSFDYIEGTNRYIKHKPTKEDRGELVAAYAIVNYIGGYDFEIVLPEDIEATKKRAPGAKKADSPWNTEDAWTMWTKTALRRLAKRIPQSPDLQRVAHLEGLVEAGLKQNISRVVNDTINGDFKEAKKDDPIDIEQTKKDVSEKLEEMQSTGQTGRSVECPNLNGQMVNVEYCSKSCSKREGCPEWD